MKKKMLGALALFALCSSAYAELPTGWSSYSEKDQMQIYKNSALNQIMVVKIVPMKQIPISAKDYAEVTAQLIKKNCEDPKVDGDENQAVIRCLHNGHESATYVFKEENYGLTICSTMNGVSEATVKEILAEHRKNNQ